MSSETVSKEQLDKNRVIWEALSVRVKHLGTFSYHPLPNDREKMEEYLTHFRKVSSELKEIIDQQVYQHENLLLDNLLKIMAENQD